VEPTEKIFIVSAWRSALQVRNFRLKIVIAVLLLILCAMVAPVIFQYVQQREGVLLEDYFLALLPSIDLSLWIFLILYSLIILSIVALATEPNRFLIAVQAYVILTTFRFISLLLTPLEPPANIIVLGDPFVEHLFYQQTITKDLFFSGHTSLLALFTFALPRGMVQKVVLTGTMLIASMLLLQHAHYTIDVLFAPFFSWLALKGSMAISKK
jgi:hypothetical protein